MNRLNEASWIKINPPVFFWAAGLCLSIVLYAVLWPVQAAGVFAAVQSWVVSSAGWFYVLAVALFLIFVVVLALLYVGGDDQSCC